MHSPSTRLWSRAYSSGGAGCARLTDNAILSAFQYDVKAMSALITSAATVNAMPLPTTAPMAAPTSPTTRMKATTSTTLRRLFDRISSNMDDVGSELDGGGSSRLLVGLEVLA